MAAKGALIEFLASGNFDARDGKAWDEGAIVAFFVPGTATGKAVWEDRDKTLPTVAGIEQDTLGTDGAVTVFGDGVYDIKIYDAADTGLTTPLKTFSSYNSADASVNSTLTDPDFLDGTDSSKIASMDMSSISSATTRTVTFPDADGTIMYAATSDNFSNKTLQDSTCTIVDNADSSKKIAFQASGITTSTTRTVTMPDRDVTLGQGVRQVVNVTDGAVATGSTVIPADDTIPQITEGNEFMTLAITPTSATNVLFIQVVTNLHHAATTHSMVTALFQDATANALAVVTGSGILNGGATQVTQALNYYMTAGTTSATTFRVRCGLGAAGTVTFNGVSSTRQYGGVMASSITITEIEP